MIVERLIKSFNLLLNAVEIKANDYEVIDHIEADALNETDIAFNEGWQNGARFVLETLREEIESWNKQNK